MIFNKLFVPKYKNQDPTKRIEAISSLDVQNQKDKSILHELAFNDVSPAVIVTALEKLNSFPLWLKASEISEHKKVKEQALMKVESELRNPHSQMLSERDFLLFCKEVTNLSLLESLLFDNQRIFNNNELALDALKRINKEHVTRRFYKERATTYQKAAIIDSIDSLSLLLKLNKLKSDSKVTAALVEKIDYLQHLEAKPREIRQRASLINSKLLASCDLTDYDLLKRTRDSLNEEFDQLKIEFKHLEINEREEIEQKYAKIRERIESKLATLYDTWVLNEALSNTTSLIANIEIQINEVVSQIDSLNLEQSPQDLSSQTKLLNFALNDASSNLVDVEQSPKNLSHERWIKRLFSVLDEQEMLIAQLPLICQANQKAIQLCEQLNDLLSQSGRSEYDSISIVELEDMGREIHANWKNEISTASTPVSASINEKWKQLNKKYRGLIQRHKTKENEQKRKLLNKLKNIRSLIEQGKFKSAISSFSYAEKYYISLPDSLKIQTEGFYKEVDERIKELLELQAFIAAPRKPALVDEAKSLGQKKPKGIKERVKQVKILRDQWSSLGTLNSEEDKELNDAFEKYIEQAFQPCREYYAEQEKQKSENKTKALEIIENLSNLNSFESDEELSKQVSSVQKSWRDLGQIEHTDYKTLKSKFNQLLEPFIKRVELFQLLNADKKTAIINKVADLLQSDDIGQAAEKAKEFQQEWKRIGYAGKKTNEKLWKEFRSINDDIFGRLSEKRSDQIKKNDALNTLINERVGVAKSDLNKVQTLKDLELIRIQLDSLKSDLQQSFGHEKNKLTAELNNIDRMIDNRSDELEKRAFNQEIEKVMDVLSSWRMDGQVLDLDGLSGESRGWFEKCPKVFEDDSNLIGDREDIVLLAELILEIPGNQSCAEKRKSLQLKMMARKLEGNELPTFKQLLIYFISFGALSTKDTEYLSRLKHIVEK